MHCNGKCQAMMKIAAQEKKQQQQEENKLNGKSEVISSKTFFATALQIYFEHISISYVTFDDDTEMNMPRSLFHPPTA